MKKHIIILTLILFQSSLRADIVTDGTLGPRENLSGPNYLIGADLGQQYGQNLFYSFQSFNVNTGETATFAGTDSIHNILARVTGGNMSVIDGTLSSIIPNVNLYFLNPYGIVFGPHAHLDIPGSFHASTADYLRLGNHGYFSARHPNDSVLTVAPVEAFGFLDNNPASITIQGSYLKVHPTKTLSIISGAIQMTDGEENTATLVASDGRINLIALDSSGEVAATFPELTTLARLGKITLSRTWGKRQVNHVLSEKFNELVEYANIDVSGEGGGKIFIRAGYLSLTNSWLFADTYGDQDNTEIDILVDGNLNLFDNTRITMSNMIGSSNNGDLQIKATNSLTLESESLIATTNFYGTGTSGDIDIETPQLSINASQIQATTLNDGKAGNIKIDAQQVKLQGIIEDEEPKLFAGINATTYGYGQAGNITINAQESISLANASSISVATSKDSSGHAGKITLNTQYLNLNNTGEVSSFSYGAGNAGTIDITAKTASLTHNGNIVTEAFNASGGQINLHITDRLSMVQSIMTTEVQGDENNDHAGDITINKPALFTVNQGEIKANANVGNGGNITITSNHFFQSSDSVLDASSKLGIDGKIQINAPEENLDEELMALPQQYSDASRLLRKNCAERAGDKDRFVVTSKIPKAVIKDLLDSPQPPVYDGLSEVKRLATYQTLQEELAKTSKINFGLQAQSKINFGLQASKINFGLQSNALGRLASLYASERRYQEALHLNQQALDVLLSPEEQVSETYLQQASQNPKAQKYREAFKLIRFAYLRYRWQWQRARLLNQIGQPEQAIAFYEKALATLEAIRFDLTQIYKNQPHSEIENIFKPLVQELVELRLQRADSLNKGPEKHQALKRILDIIEQLKAEQLRDYFKDGCIESKEIGEIGKNTAVIYPIFLPNRVELFVNLSANEIRNQTVAVTPEQLTFEINLLRENLACQQEDYEARRQCPKSLAYRKSAYQLYQWLIRPLESLFSNWPIYTLVFVPDGPLYTIPMAALYDGQQFLVEKYAIAVMPGLTLQVPQTTQTIFQTGKIQVLYTGLTQSYANPPSPLKFAKMMGNAIQQIFVTEILDGHRFVKTEIANALNQKPYSIVHIMSHAQFKDVGLDTYVNTYDDKLSLDDFETLLAPTQFRKQPIELLTLGACETAEGNERAALGLSGIAFKAGARSAIGTLWEVEERVSVMLFQIFYQQLKFNKTVSRARRLQTTQKTFLQNPKFKHPYYWSAFLLIGNW